jgi:hypothetical protein
VVGVSAGVLSITGDANANQVTVSQDDALNRIVVSVRDTPTSALRTSTFAASAVSKVSANLWGGDDRLTWNAASDSTRARTMEVLMGTGKDQATFDFGKSSLRTLSGNLDLKLWSGGGDDIVRADFGHLQAQTLAVQVDLSDGVDQAYANVWGVLRGTKAKFSMDGGNQNDTLRFSHDSGSWAGSALTVNVHGGAGDDDINVFYDDIISGAYRFVLVGDGGNDTVTANIWNRYSPPGPALGSLYVQIYGKEGADKLGLHLTNETNRLQVLNAGIDGGRHTDGTDTDGDRVLWGSTTPNVTRVNMG